MIKGIIPFYPAYKLADQYISGEFTFEFLNPELLITFNSPPCLIYHGSGDGKVLPEISESLKNTYNINGNNECALILFPTASHLSDIYFAGYFNQLFLYYMERFSYLYH